MRASNDITCPPVLGDLVRGRRPFLNADVHGVPGSEKCVAVHAFGDGAPRLVAEVAVQGGDLLGRVATVGLARFREKA